MAKVWICGRPLAGNAGSNPTGGLDVGQLRVLCVVRWRSLNQADHSPRGVMNVKCLVCVIVKP
jgi:hypothetical protein